MKKPRQNFCFAFAILAVITMAGCSSAPPADVNSFAAPTQLTARLASPIDIDLKWKHNAAFAAGNFVEYSPEANDDFVIIEALPPGATSYRHPHLLPRTRFVFRIVPFFGPASGTAGIRTGAEGPQQPPSSAKISRTNSLGLGIKKSIRSMATFAAAAPTDFRATLIPPAGVKLDWVDHASDADGDLLEVKPEGSRDFKVSAFLPPHTTTLTSYGYPFNTKFAFRVRPVFYGPPSNLAEQTTGNDPSFSPGPWIKSEPQKNP